MQASTNTRDNSELDKKPPRGGPGKQGPSIEISSVSLNLGNTPILEDVNFSVQAGTIHCIIGENGGGKTSLIRSILGQMPHTGKIEINWSESTGEQRTIGYVPQHLNFDMTLPVTLNDFLTITTQHRPVFLGATRVRRKQVSDVLKKFGLADKRGYKLGNLSGGERQRAIFAQAFIPEPSLLVLDEPMTGLDVSGGEILLSAVREFTDAGGTIIWINHDIVQVYEVADQLTYIDKSVKLDGAPREVLRSGAARNLFPTLHFAEEPSLTSLPEQESKS